MRDFSTSWKPVTFLSCDKLSDCMWFHSQKSQEVTLNQVTGGLIDWLMNWLTDWWIDWLLEWLTDWGLTDRLRIDWLTDGLTDWWQGSPAAVSRQTGWTPWGRQWRGWPSRSDSSSSTRSHSASWAGPCTTSGSLRNTGVTVWQRWKPVASTRWKRQCSFLVFCLLVFVLVIVRAPPVKKRGGGGGGNWHKIC